MEKRIGFKGKRPAELLATISVVVPDGILDMALSFGSTQLLHWSIFWSISSSGS